MEKILNYIGGKLSESSSSAWIDNHEPSTGEVYSQLPDSNKNDVEKAYSAAKEAFPEWSQKTAKERSQILMRIADLIAENLEELAEAESKDNGKPLNLAKNVDIPRAAENFRFYATAILHTQNEMFDMGNQGFNYVLRRPIGVAGLISPWNLPLYLFTWKIAPALATGNTAVAKPSELTPMTAFLLSKICIEAGLPAGVLNIVHGFGHKVGDAITAHPDIPVISFTGGTSTGKLVAANAAKHFKKVSLELGGKNPTMIFDDCDYEKALKTTIRSSFSNQGQICLCGSRLLVQEGIYERFVKDYVSAIKELKVGAPEDENTVVGALISESHREKVMSYIQSAKEDGGKIECGGEIPKDLPNKNNAGYFLQPTVITGLNSQCKVNQEEIFGPVVTILPFKDEAEAIAIANSTQYGLAASIWTENLKRAHQVAEKIDIGIVWINSWMVRDLRTPFGGMKHSGVGREGGMEALHFFTEAKNVFVGLE